MVGCQRSEPVWTTSISIFEIQFGIDTLPKGKRKRELESQFEQSLSTDIRDQVLKFGEPEAYVTAAIASDLQSRGKTIEFRDAAIAGIVSHHNATLSTRNVRHFSDTGIKLVNPWED